MLEAVNSSPLYTEALSSIAAHDYATGRQRLTDLEMDLTTQVQHTQNADEEWSIASRIRYVQGRQAFATVEQKLWLQQYAADTGGVPNDVLQVLDEVQGLLRNQVVRPNAIPPETGPAARGEIAAANIALYGFLGRTGTIRSVIGPAAERSATTTQALADFHRAAFLAGRVHDYQELAIQSLYAARLTDVAGMPARTEEWLIQLTSAVLLLTSEASVREVEAVEAVLKIGQVTVSSLFEHP